MSHTLLAVAHALILGLFFATLWRDDRPSRILLFGKIFVGLLLGYYLLGWLMYFVPSGPPTTIP